MQQRNLLIFLVLSAGLLFGWWYVGTTFFPQEDPKSVDREQIHKDSLPAKLVAQSLGGQALTPTGGPLAGLTQILIASRFSNPDAIDLAAKYAPEMKKVAEKKKTEPKPKKTIKIAERPPQPTQADTVKILGDSSFYIQTRVTSRGAGVQKVTLTRFKAADWNGQPTNDPLDLVQYDDIMPSFLMYHYPPEGTKKASKSKSSRPLPDLGTRHWKFLDEGFIEVEVDGEKRSVRNKVSYYTVMPPGPYEGLKITKTFTLEPKSYHIGLKLKFEDTRERSNPKEALPPFKYQLVGAHGLPLEGAWYSYVHRNALIGVLGIDDRLYRTLETSNTIRFREGGERVPEGPRNQDGIQYAAVVTQFLASAIVVPRDQSLWPKIIAYARPTLEAHECYCEVIEKVGTDALKLRILDGLKPIVDDEGNTKDVVTARFLPRAIADFQREEFDLEGQVKAIFSIYEADTGEFVVSRVRKGTKPWMEFADITVRMVSEAFQPEEAPVHDFLLYHGPVKVRQLNNFVYNDQKKVDPALVDRYSEELHLDTFTDYRSEGYFGAFFYNTGITSLLIFLTKIMHGVFFWISRFVPVQGLAIIIMTVVVRGALFPLSRRQALMSIKMQALAPELKKLKEKYAEPMEQQQAMWELYRKHGVNPAMGCLPLLLQLPIFLGLYYSLQESIGFRLGTFLWIQNLAAPDMLWFWGDDISVISSMDNFRGGWWLIIPLGFLYLGPYLNLLPILAVIVMFIQQQIMMPPATDEQQEAQQKMMRFLPVVLLLMFYKIASGLAIYFIATTFWGLVERWLLPKKEDILKKMKTEALTEPKKGTTAAQKLSGKMKSGKSSRKKGAMATSQKKMEPQGFFQNLRDRWDEILKEAKKKQ
ncbi:MAG: membrane protein insertase YidC [Gemmataceae bacterium]